MAKQNEAQTMVQVTLPGGVVVAMTMADAEAYATAAAIKAKAEAKVSFKVSEKGGLSVYGLGGRFPVTLYVPAWQKALSEPMRSEILGFIEANASRFSTGKDDPRFSEAREKGKVATATAAAPADDKASAIAELQARLNALR